jgi:hypothetical protein
MSTYLVILDADLAKGYDCNYIMQDDATNFQQYGKEELLANANILQGMANEYCSLHSKSADRVCRSTEPCISSHIPSDASTSQHSIISSPVSNKFNGSNSAQDHTPLQRDDAAGAAIDGQEPHSDGICSSEGHDSLFWTSIPALDLSSITPLFLQDDMQGEL